MATKVATPEPTTPINPILVTARGINALFARAAVVGIFLAAIGVFGAAVNVNYPAPGSKDSHNVVSDAVNYVKTSPIEQLVLFAVIIFVIAVLVFVFSTLIHGLQSYTALQLSKGKRVGLNEAASAVMSHFGSYLLFYFWMNIKIFLWSLLLIIPGIIAYFRYTFAGQLFFDNEKLRLDKPLKESSRLAHGGLLTIFASQFLFNLITFSYLNRIVSVASGAQLYTIYKELDAKSEAKPKAHWLSWLTLALPFIFLLVIISFGVVIGVILAVAKK